jgi:hypothetical protein
MKMTNTPRIANDIPRTMGADCFAVDVPNSSSPAVKVVVEDGAAELEVEAFLVEFSSNFSDLKPEVERADYFSQEKFRRRSNTYD